MADEMKPKKSVSVSDIMSKEPAAKTAKPKAESKTEAKPGASKDKKAKHKHTHIEHHDDGSHTIRHSGAGDEVSYAAPDMDAVHDGLEQHIGGANADEGQGQGQEPPDMPGAQSQGPQPQPQAMPGQGA